MATKLSILVTVICEEQRSALAKSEAQGHITHGRFMIVVFVVAIGPQAIFLVISWMTGHSLIGVNLFNMAGRVLVDDWRVSNIAGTGLRALVCGCHRGQQAEKRYRVKVKSFCETTEGRREDTGAQWQEEKGEKRKRG